MFRGAHVNQVLLSVIPWLVVDYSYLNANLTRVLHLYFPLVPVDCKMNTYSFIFCTIFFFPHLSPHCVEYSLLYEIITALPTYTCTLTVFTSLSGVNVDYLVQISGQSKLNVTTTSLAGRTI